MRILLVASFLNMPILVLMPLSIIYGKFRPLCRTQGAHEVDLVKQYCSKLLALARSHWPAGAALGIKSMMPILFSSTTASASFSGTARRPRAAEAQHTAQINSAAPVRARLTERRDPELQKQRQ